LNGFERVLRILLVFFTVACVLALSSESAAVGTATSRARPGSPLNVNVLDNENDSGGAIRITWEASLDDGKGRGSVNSYIVFRSQQPETGFVKIKAVESGRETYAFVDSSVMNDVRYYYRVTAETGTGEFSDSGVVGPIMSSAQWFNTQRSAMLVALLVCALSVLFYIFRAKSGRNLYVRPIAGLEAVDEAVGRATEMGRPVLFVPGIMDMDDIQTIAGVAILGRVARKTAEYETPLSVPVSRSIVMSAAQETVKEAYWNAGRPDAYHDDMVRYLTDDQFGFAAGVDGIIVREQPAAIFLQGAFYAESLILAETGNDAGAIQIAGTAMPSQLPFFVTACDYTLIGEELFAAGAYLTQDPRLVGSLKGQDLAKALAIALIVLGVILRTAGHPIINRILTIE